MITPFYYIGSLSMIKRDANFSAVINEKQGIITVIKLDT
jgi:hypothetical protein